MARTDGLFYIRQSAYVSPVNDASIWLRGNDKYISFRSTAGASGYGIRDNDGVLQFKNSGGSWTNIGTGGGGGMSIGGTITGATVGSVLFVGASGVLQEDNANFFWDDTNNRLALGTNIADFRLDILGTDLGSSGIEMTRFSDNTFSPTIQSRKARGTSGTPVVVNAGDVLWRVQALGYDGTAYDNAGNISLLAHDVTGGVVTGAFQVQTANNSGTSVTGIYMDKNQKTGLGATPGSASGRLTLGGTVTSEGRGNLGAFLTINNGAPATATDTTASGTVSLANTAAIFGTTFATTNTVTYTNASTLFIGGAPVAGTNVTLTNTWALYVNSGESFFQGGLLSSGAVRTATVRATSSSGTVFQTNGASDVLHIGNGGGVNATAYGGWNFDAATANRVAVFGASKTLSSSSVTTTELGYVSGVTSSIQTQLNAKQGTLVSGTNIKTINGNSILGSGDLTISGGGSPGGVSGELQINSSGSFGGADVYRNTATIEIHQGTTAQNLDVFGTWATSGTDFEAARIRVATGSSSTKFAQLLATSGGTGAANMSIALTPLGTGAISAHVPDSTATGGNARGTTSTDWQRTRGAATQVASGDLATISGGSGNTASGQQATVAGGISNSATALRASVGGGSSNSANGTNATVAGGATNQASGQNSTVSGGGNNTASGNHSFVPGGQQATTRALVGARAYSSGQRSAQGDAQIIGQPVRRTTTAASATDLTADGNAVSSTNVMVMPNNSSAGFVAKVAARNATTVGSGYWEVRGTIERGANAASTALVGSVTVTSFGISASLGSPTITVVANTTQGGPVIQVTPANTDTTYWVADLELVQVA